MRCFVKGLVFVLLLGVSSGVLAQTVQPGAKLLAEIATLVSSGQSVKDATASALTNALAGKSITLTAQQNAFLTANRRIAEQFIEDMATGTSTVEQVLKVTIETKPNNKSFAATLVTLSVIFYPAYTTTIMQTAVLTGAINDVDVVIAAIRGGADVNTVFQPAAAGGTTGGATGGGTTDPIGGTSGGSGGGGGGISS